MTARAVDLAVHVARVAYGRCAAHVLGVARTAVVVVVVGAVGCPRSHAPTHEANVYFRGEIVGHVEDVVDGRHIERREHIAVSGETVETDVDLDESGLAVRARYVRGAVRTVTLDGTVLSAADAHTTLAHRGLVIDLLRYAEPRGPIDVDAVDLSSGDFIAARVERRGAEVVVVDAHGGVVARANVEGTRTGPGAFTEGDAPEALSVASVSPAWAAPSSASGARILGVDDVVAAMDLDGAGTRRGDGPGASVTFSPAAPARAATPADRAPGLFLESADSAVVAFAHAHAAGHEVLADAASIADAVHALVDANKTDVPPSARGMLDHGGDCDGAAALVTASLRALGRDAHPVVGYRVVDNRLVAHAWAELYAGDHWVIVDATVPFVGVDAQHIKLFDGLGSALTMGRVLGRIRFEPIISAAAPRPSVPESFPE